MTGLEKTAALVADIQDGQSELMPELWEQVRGFIVQQSMRRYRATGGFGAAEADDYIQSGYPAMVKAVETYSDAEGMSFLGWLAMHLKSAFADAEGRRSTRQSKDPIHSCISLDLPVGDDGGSTLAELQEDPSGRAGFESVEDAIYQQQLHDALEEALGKLTEPQAETVKARFYQGRTMQEIAVERGISPDAVKRLEGDGLRNLRKPKIRYKLEQFVEERTPYFMHVGVQGFHSTNTSATEKIMLMRENMRQRH